MKLRPLFRSPLAASIVSLLAASAAFAVDGTWTNPAGGSWPMTAHWSGGSVATGTDAIADFSTLNLTADATVTLDGARTVGTLVFGDAITASHNWNLNTGTAGPLTLANTAGTPTLNVVNQTATIGAIVAGTQGISKTGLGTLTLSGANIFTGQLLIGAGTVKAGNAASLGGSGAGNETVVLSGATFDVNGQALTTTEILNIAGNGVGGNGALVNNGSAQLNALNKVVLTADAAVGGTTRFDIRSGATPTLDLAGFTLTKVGVNDFHLVGTAVTNGNININAGIFAIETTSTLLGGAGAGTITIGAAGTLGLYQTTGANVTRDIISNGGTIGNLGVAATINSNILLTPGTTTALNSSSGGGTTLAGVISGSGALSKGGSDTFTLSGNNTYTGGTTITSGTLNLNFADTSAPIANILASTGVLAFNGVGTLSLTGKASTTNSQTFSSTALNSGGASITLTPSATANPLSLNLGTLTRSAGATVNLTQPTGTVSATNGIVFTAGAGVAAPAASTLITASNGAAFATVGGTDWAAMAPTNSFVVGLSTIAGGYTPFSTGTVTLTGNADLTSATAGTYTLGAASAPSTIRNTTITGNTIALGGFNLTIGGYLSNVATTISGTGGLTAANAGGELVLNQTANTTTIVGNLSDNFASSVTKTGAGTIAVSGTQGYTGVTNVAQGTFQMGSTTGQNGAAGILATSGINVSSGATFNLGAGTLGTTQNITGAGNFQKGGNFITGGTINGTNNNYTGSTSVSVGTLTVGTGAVINGTSSISIATGNNSILVNSGSITSPGALTMGGGSATAGIFTNNASGILNVSSIAMTAGSSMTNSGTINNSGVFTSNGTFIGTGTSALTTGALTVGGAFTLGSGSTFTDTAGTIVINSGGAVTFGSTSQLTSIVANGITINAGGSLAAPGSVNNLLASGKILNASTGAIALSGDSPDNINFTGFNALGLTSTGTATYSGTITPVAGGYRFGGSATSDLTIASPLIGANTLTQSGTGRTNLVTANSYTGTTTVSGGTLAIGNGGSINGGAVSITGGILAVIGSGTLNATSGGTVSIGAGNLVTTSVNNIGASGSTIALTGAGVSGLQYVGAGETTNRILGFNTASAGGVVTASGAGPLTFSNPATTTATAAFGVIFNGQGAGSFVGITQPATARLINFNKQGVGTWTLTGLNNLTGGAFRADGGVLNFAATATTGTGANAATISRNAANGGVLTIASGASVITSTANTNGILGGWATFGGDTWAVTNGNAAAISGLATFTNDWLTATGNADILASNTSGGLVVNSLRFNTAAAVTQTLSGANVITSGGILVTPAVGANITTITGGTSLGSGTTDLIIHQNNTAGGLTVGSLITGTTGVTKAGSGTLTFNAQKTYTGTTNVLAGVLDLTGGGGSAGTIRGTANIATGATLRLSSSDVTGYATDATRLSTINLLGGTLNVNTTGNQTLGSATINMTGGAITGIAGSNLDFFGGSSTLNTLASGTTSVISGVGIAALRQGNTTFTVAQGYTISGIDLDIQSVVQNGGAGAAANAVLNKAGNGTLALSGTNTIGGNGQAWLISGGTLMVGNGGATGTLSTINVTNNSRLAFNRSDAAGSFANVISGTGSVVQIGSGTTTLTAANTFTGGTTVNAGTLVASGPNGASGALGGGNVTVNNGGTIRVGGDNSFVGGATSATRAITINAGGLIANTGSSTNHLNALILNGGTLSATTANALYGNWNFDHGVSTVGGTTTVSAISGGNAALTQTGGTVFNIQGSDALTVSTVLAHVSGSSDTGLIKSGTGTLTLSGANTYTGATMVNAGMLDVSGSLANTALTVQTGAGFRASGIIGGAVTIDVGGSLSGSNGTFNAIAQVNGSHQPGSSPGLQTFTAGLGYGALSVLGIELVGDSLGLRGTDYDGVNVTGGNLTISPSASLDLNALSINYATAVWDTDRSFTIIDFSGAGSSTGGFALNTTGAGSFAGEGNWTLGSTDGDVVLNWTAVPEPATAVLGALGMLMVLRRRRPAA